MQGASFVMALNPIPCPRPRITVRGRIGHAYYPAAYKTWKAEAAKLIEQAMDQNVINTYYDVPLQVLLVCVVQRPKASKLIGPKPDVDNYAKAIMDAMTEAGAWGDDSQVIDLRVVKRWTDDGETGNFTVTIAPVTDVNVPWQLRGA